MRPDHSTLTAVQRAHLGSLTDEIERLEDERAQASIDLEIMLDDLPLEPLRASYETAALGELEAELERAAAAAVAARRRRNDYERQLELGAEGADGPQAPVTP